jgi:hypothetical protein
VQAVAANVGVSSIEFLLALGPCHPFDRRRLNPRQDSRSGGPKGSRSDVRSAPLTAILRGFKIEAPEGWPLLPLARQR